MSETSNLLLLAGDALVYFAVLAALFRARHRLGIGAFFCALGVMHFLETYLASILYVALPFGIVTSPGSSVLFTGKLMLLLLVYIREDAVVVRQPIYGLLIGNLLMVGLAAMIRHARRSFALAPGRVADFGLLNEMGALMVWGTALLFVDCILHHSAVRALARLARRPPVPAAGLERRRGAELRPAVLLCRPDVPDRRAAVGADRRLGRQDGRGRDLQRAGVRLSALARAAGAASASRAADLRRVRHADLSRALRGPSGPHRPRRAHRRVRPRTAGDARSPQPSTPRPTRGRPVSLLLIDIDHFKSFNDRFGHASGDAVLKRIAREIMATVRATDLVFRFGGEEFVVICDGLPAEPALSLGERIRREIAASDDDPASRVTVSIGIATCAEDAADYDALFQVADKRLYQAKAAGRNCVIGERVASTETPVRLAFST